MKRVLVLLLSMAPLPFLTASAQTSDCDFSAPNSRDAAWSPDGTTLIFDSTHDGNRELYSMDAGGTNMRRLTNTEGAEYYPFFSPDGSRITYMVLEGDHTVIWIADADGSNPTQLTPDGETNADPFFSADGFRIVFYSEKDGNAEIYTMNLDGSEWQRLTESDATETTPIWSPDGSSIAFVSNRDGNAELYVMDTDGGNVRRVTNSSLSDRVPRWLPDGTGLIYYSRPSTADSSPEARAASWAAAEIKTINIDGTGEQQLTNNNFLDQSPAFSPDGSRITFTSCRDGSRQIHVMDADGSNVRQLTGTSQ